MKLAFAAVLVLAQPAMALADEMPARESPSLMAAVLRVNDANAVRSFYESVLGMKVLMSRDLGSIHETMLSFGNPAAPGILLVNRLAAGGEPLRGVGASRLIVRAPNLGAIVERMDAAHLSHGPIRDPAPGVRVLDVADPEGNQLEIVQRSQGR